MPVYNGGSVVKETINCILNQNFGDFELVICDDNSKDNTAKIINGFKDGRIKFFSYDQNVGYPLNLRRCFRKCSNDIIFLMGQDDIIAPGILERVSRIFEEHKNVGAITRPYYWFSDDISKPVRAKGTLDDKKDRVVSINDDFVTVVQVFDTLDQLSGLALRRQFLEVDVHEDVFTAHIYPFASIFKNHKVVYLKDYVVAVRIGTSQTRHVSAIYSKSPMESWVNMFQTVFADKKFDAIKEHCIKKFVAKNFVGLVQIRNYGDYNWLCREIKLLVKYDRNNLFNARFWFYSLGTLLLPRTVLAPLTDYYKDHILSKSLTHIKTLKIEKPKWEQQ
jgi:glycosyltransferase involved in cell wall biosynthesis